MSTVFTHDLRSQAKDYQRDRNHNAKWARGTAAAPGKKCFHTLSLGPESCADCAKKPLHRDFNRRCGRHYTNSRSSKLAGQSATLARKVFRKEVLASSDAPMTVVSDSSGDEDIVDVSAAPVPEVDIMYSYDAAHGPGKGSDVLSHAINQAVLRYENKETEKLVKEYDLVEDVKDNNQDYAIDTDEDGFEMIDHARLE